MAKLHINIGDTANDRTGDPLRTAFDKVNQNFDELYTRTGDDIQIPPLAGNGGKVLTTNGTTLSWNVGLSVSDFGEGFGLDNANKIVTRKLYSTNQTNSTQHYRLELDTNGVVHLPDQSIINGATLKTVPGNYAGITAGPVGRDEDSWVWVDNDGTWIATDYSDNAYTWHFNNTGKLTLPLGSSINEEIITVGGGGSTTFTIASDFQSQIDVGGTNIGVANTVENQQIVAGWTITFADGTTTRVANSSTGSSGPSGEYNIFFDTPVSLLEGFPITVSGPSGPGTDSVNLKLSPATDVSWTFSADGTLSSPNGATQQGTGSVNCQAGVDTVVYTSSQQGVQTIKLLLKVEGVVTAPDDADTQSCEMIIAKGFRGHTVEASVYGVVYTSNEPLATFTAEWNAVSSRVEVLCRPTSLTNSVDVKSFATEITTSD